MKGVFVFLAILSLLAVGTLSYHSAQKPVPAIGVKVVAENAWSGSTAYLPMVNGFSTAFKSASFGEPDGSYAVSASYQLVSTSPQNFFVLAHFEITRNGISTEVDKTLPVLPSYKPSPIAQEKLKRTTWTNLDNHLSAFAYMSESTINY
jgi:hypothetical protein